MDDTWFLIWRHELLRTFHRLSGSHIFRWVTWNPTRRKILHHDCTTMLGLLVFDLLDLSVKTARSVDSSSELPLISSCAFSFGTTTDRSNTTLCESGSSPERPRLERLKPLWNLLRPVLQCLDTWENAAGRPMPAWVLQAWNIGLKNFSRLRML